jgi:hypothetical protein
MEDESAFGDTAANLPPSRQRGPTREIRPKRYGVLSGLPTNRVELSKRALLSGRAEAL